MLSSSRWRRSQRWRRRQRPASSSSTTSAAIATPIAAASTSDAPSLKGVVGRKIASLPDFQYCTGLKAKRGTWTESALDAFLFNPRGFAPGKDMSAGAADPGVRRAIIDYLKTVK